MRPGTIALALAATLGALTIRTEAHKPITSPFTFNDDVLPIVKTHCADCHSPGGVGPMSLLTHTDAVPWAESIRVELMAGHMPPWRVDSAAARFRNLPQFAAREMNVLMTWASGGTPLGKPDAETVVASTPQWTLGKPDQTIALPAVSIAGDAQAYSEEFRIPAPARPLRAVDLLPGTPSIVRRATISVGTPADARAAGITPERLVALWLPGDHPVSLDAGLGFQVPAGAELIVRVDYRKTWQYERQAMADQSTIGLYFADSTATDVQVVRALSAVTSGTPATFSTTVGEDVRAVALYADPDLSGGNVRVVAVRPGAPPEELISFRPQAEWGRRYWFREPVSLPRGTRIQVTATFDGESLLPPAAPRPASAPGARSVSLALNVVRAN